MNIALNIAALLLVIGISGSELSGLLDSSTKAAREMNWETHSDEEIP